MRCRPLAGFLVRHFAGPLRLHNGSIARSESKKYRTEKRIYDFAARQRIVEGAVGMVQMALDMLSAKEIVHLDEERRAVMVSNLLVVLCGERGAQPVLNTGTLYQ
jgi:hypothetical protein